MTQKNNQHAVYRQRLKQLFVSSRPISWVNTAFPFVAGYLFTNGQINLYFLLASLYFLIPYNVLIYVVNDVFDYESDVRNPRKNSIEGGLLAPETHRFMLLATGILNVLFVTYLFLGGTLASNSLLFCLVFAALSYSMPPIRLKERPFLDSINSSLHFVGPLLFGLVLTGWKPHYWPYGVAFFMWGCASHAFGAVQDIKADREAAIQSIATHLGARQTVRLSLLLYLSVFVLLAAMGWPELILCPAALLYIVMVAPFITISDAKAETANKGWKNFLIINQFAGFLITLLLIKHKLF